MIFEKTKIKTKLGYSKPKVLEMRKKRDEEEKKKEEEERNLRSSMSRATLIGSLKLIICPYCEAPCSSTVELQNHMEVCEVLLSIN